MNIIQWFKNLFIGKGKPPTLADIILAYNHPFINYYPTGSKIVNAEVHKITTATIVANLITSQAKRVGLDPLFLAACLNQESMMDPNCYNKNLKEHNGINSFAGTDWGIAQFSGKYLPTMPGMQNLNQTQMYLKAFDVTWAIPVFADKMLSLCNQALTWLQNKNNLNAVMEINNTMLTNEEFVATGSYNAGFTGFTNLVLNNPKAIVHPFRVAQWFQQFHNILNGGKGIPWNVGVNVTWKF